MIGTDGDRAFGSGHGYDLIGRNFDDANAASGCGFTRGRSDDATERDAEFAAGRDVLCGDDALQVVIVARGT